MRITYRSSGETARHQAPAMGCVNALTTCILSRRRGIPHAAGFQGGDVAEYGERASVADAVVGEIHHVA